MKRWLYFIHRWGGVALALFMLLWFVSGLVIVFAGQLPVSRSQHLAHVQPLAVEPGWLSLGEAWEKSAEARKARNAGATFNDARLTRIDGQPVWQVEDDKGQRLAVSAINGALIDFGDQQAARIAAQWAGVDKARFVETLDATSSLRNYTAFKPFHRIALDDTWGTELLVSARSGEVLQAANSWQRGLFIAGNWLHLFRFLDSVGLADSRRDVLTWAGGLAFIAGLTGLIIGIIVYRPGWFGRPTYSKGRTQPYGQFWLKWHFWSGLIAGTFAVLWAFSGYLVNNPFGIFSNATASKEELARYYDRALPASAAQWVPAAPNNPNIVELSWRRLGNEAVLLGWTKNGKRVTLGAAFGEQAVKDAATRLAGGKAEVASVARQDEYDNYYYPNHHQGLLEKPLPVYRVELADAGNTRLYVDAEAGALLLKQDDSRRAYRWLFSAIHHWDLPGLYTRPLWDLWMVAWTGFGGLILGVSSVYLGWRRLRLTFRRRLPAPEVAKNLATAPSNS